VSKLRRLYQVAAILGLLSLALVVAAPVHVDDETQSGDHCAICHLRHVSAVESSSTAAPSLPDLLACALVIGAAHDEIDSCVRLHPSRGPPA
jgi:hypothetical protein